MRLGAKAKASPKKSAEYEAMEKKQKEMMAELMRLKEELKNEQAGMMLQNQVQMANLSYELKQARESRELAEMMVGEYGAMAFGQPYKDDRTSHDARMVECCEQALTAQQRLSEQQAAAWRSVRSRKDYDRRISWSLRGRL